MSVERPDHSDALKRAERRAAALAGYWSHLSAYVIVIGVLVVINLVAWDGYFWAIWPMLGWGIGLLFHSLNVFGPNWGDREWQRRKAQDIVARNQQRANARWGESASPASWSDESPSIRQPPHAPSAPATLNELTTRAGDEIDRLRRVARQIPTPDVRREALEVLASADQIVAALGDGSGNVEMARTFLDRYLGPTGTILIRYQRLAGREIAAAEPALRRVEDHDLPLLNRRMHELHDQLHQGDVIDLQVASEMLAFELDEPDPSGPSIDAGATSRPNASVRRASNRTNG